MRPSSHATTIVAFILGAAIAGGGTATAAKLITGKDIKDGSITAKDLSPQVRAKLGTGQAGPKGDTGARGEKGDKGDPGVSLITFADSYIYDGRPLTNTDAVMTSTAGQLPDASGGGAGGPINIPAAASKVVQRVSVSITTQGSGVYECALQVGVNGGAFFDMKRPPATSASELTFEFQSGSFTNKSPVALQYRLVCNGAATRKVVDASLTVIGGAV